MDSLFSLDHDATEFREMMSNRRLSTISGWLTCGVLLLSSLSAMGQNRLDPGIVSSPDFWTPAQRQTAETYVDRNLAAIQSGEEAEIDRGRTSLTDPPQTAGASPRFISQFAEMVSSKIAPLMASDNLKVRLNAMVICMTLVHPEALGAIEQGLADESAGVRYPAARAIEAQLASGQLSAAQTQQVLTNIQLLIVAENDVYVVQPLFEAMLAAPNQSDQVLDVLNARLVRHIDQPAASFAPEGSALQAIYSRLVTAQQRPENQVKQLALASTRYFLLCAQQLASGDLPADRDASREDVIRVAAVALEFAHGELRSDQLAPRGPGQALSQQDWSALVRIAEGWVEVLKADPFNFSDADLDVANNPQAAAQ